MWKWLFILLIVFVADCKRKNLNIDIEECDTMGNFYESGEHYINREFISDEGAIDYNRTFEKLKPENSRCHPTRTFDSNLYNQDDSPTTTPKP
ncbi:MAG: hypothetical protein H7A24_01195 [Leptospiraceae bacterium]|nr:hypothetical protein [Leptospiraceae bacterium]MCP5510468.1 hypothetical protein [Leptospiraceae bacterium]